MASLKAEIQKISKVITKTSQVHLEREISTFKVLLLI